MAADAEVLRRLGESLDPLPFAVVVLDRAGAIVWANPRAFEQLGIGPGSRAGPSAWRERLALDRALAGERVLERELTVESEAAGRVLSVSAVPVRGDDGDVIGAYALAREIGDQLRAERARSRALGELAATYDALPGLLFHLRADGTIVDFRVGAGRSLYTMPEQFLGRRVGEVLPPAAAKPVEEALEAARRGEPATAVYRLPGPQGERRFEARLTRWLDDDCIAIVRERAEERPCELEREGPVGGSHRERAWLEALLRQMPSGGLLVDAATRRVVLVNDPLERILGRRLPPGIDLDTYVRQAWIREGAPLPIEELPILRAVDCGETVAGEELELIRGDGLRVRVRVNAGPVRDASGRTLAGITVVSDVTAQRRAEEALRAVVETRLELSTLADLERALGRAADRVVPALADFCCIDLLENGVFRRAAWAACEPEVERLAKALVPGRTASAGGVSPQTSALVQKLEDAQLEAMLDPAHRGELLAGCAPRSLTAVPLRIGGALAGSMTFAFCRSGRSYGPGDLPALATLGDWVAAAVADARRFARAKAALEDAEGRAARLGALFQNMREAIAVLDGAGHVLIRNPAMKRLAGLDDEQGESVLHFPGVRLFALSGERLPAQRWPTARLAVGESIVDEEYLLERADGSRRRILCSGISLRETHGAAGLALFVAHDVTALRELEGQREDFIRALSHDLRQPLAVVLSSAEMLQRKLASGPDSPELAAVSRILRGARRMRAMTRDLIESARLESGALSLRREPHRLAGLLEEIATHAGTPEEQARIVLDLGEAAGATASVDPEQLERAVVNLLTNALKYSPPTAPVRLSLRQVAGEALIAVADQGVGIPKDVIPRLFSRYFRAEGERQEGIGLGLYIARLIVNAHGGRIWVDSEPARGSTFSIALAVCG